MKTMKAMSEETLIPPSFPLLDSIPSSPLFLAVRGLWLNDQDGRAASLLYASQRYSVFVLHQLFCTAFVSYKDLFRHFQTIKHPHYSIDRVNAFKIR